MSETTTFPLPAVTRQWFVTVQDEMAQAITGHSEILEQLVITLLCREHALVEGPAGTAKWLAVESLGRCFGLTTSRLRCSPDLELKDFSGEGVSSDMWKGSFLVVDRFDRLAPKLRNVIQQAMHDRFVMEGAVRRDLIDPFVIYATRHRDDDQILPESNDPNQDRFLFQINIPYPNYHNEYQVAATKSGDVAEPPRQRFSSTELDAWRSLVRQIEVPPSVIHYAVRLVRATRVHEGENPDFIYEWVQQGAGTRAAHFLVLAAKARATLHGRAAATHDDVQTLTMPVLRHRIVTNRNARTNGIDSDRVIRRLLDEIPQRVVGDDKDPAPGDSLSFHNWVELKE